MLDPKRHQLRSQLTLQYLNPLELPAVAPTLRPRG
jgi:hypothetical protein